MLLIRVGTSRLATFNKGHWTFEIGLVRQGTSRDVRWKQLWWVFSVFELFCYIAHFSCTVLLIRVGTSSLTTVNKGHWNFWNRLGSAGNTQRRAAEAALVGIQCIRIPKTQLYFSSTVLLIRVGTSSLTTGNKRSLNLWNQLGSAGTPRDVRRKQLWWLFSVFECRKHRNCYNTHFPCTVLLIRVGTSRLATFNKGHWTFERRQLNHWDCYIGRYSVYSNSHLIHSLFND